MEYQNRQNVVTISGSEFSVQSGPYSHNPNSKRPNPAYKRMVSVTLFSYTGLLASAPVVLIIYIILLTSISQKLNLSDTGNVWTFWLLFATCGIVISVTLAYILIVKCKHPLRYKQVIWLDMILIMCWFGMMWVALGAAEKAQDRSACYDPKVRCTKHHAPLVPTKLGEFILRVCGNGTNIQDIRHIDAATPVSTTGNLYLDPKKCDAARELQIIIWCMYVWCSEILLLVMLDGTLGLGSFRKRGVPEYLE